MIKRKIYKNIIDSLNHFPVVGILGSRQVGKTTIAKEISTSIKNSIYLDLELPSDLKKLENAELYLTDKSDKLVIIDEVQKMGELFSLIRALVDKKRKPGRFLLLGSASPELIKNSSESLAGRIIYHQLPPFTIDEVGFSDDNLNNLWLRGGYPKSFLAATNKQSLAWRNSFIQTFLEQDIPQLGFRIPSSQLRKFWTMLAHLHGRVWNASLLSKSMGMSYHSMNNYLGILTDTFLLRQLQPYHHNIKKRLVKAPKVYIRDSGLLHSLINIPDNETLYSHPILGFSWEGFIIEQILNSTSQNVIPYFYRTHAGAEIDLLLDFGHNRLTAIEIKHSLAPKVGKEFYNAFNDLECNKGYIIYPGKESYRIAENVWVISLEEFLINISSLNSK